MRREHREAFTLVELLVVIGIITILVGILLPTLGGARKSALSVKCMSNLRQITQGCLMHAQNHRGYLPLAGKLTVPNTITGMPDGLWDRDRTRYTYAKAPLSALSTFQLVPLPGAIAPHLGYSNLNYADWNVLDQQLNAKDGVWKMFTCPLTDSLNNRLKFTNSNDSTPIGQGNVMEIAIPSPGTPSCWSTNLDYAPNEAVFGFEQNAAYGKVRLRGKLSAIRRPSETVLFSDAKRSEQPATYYQPDGWIVWSTELTAAPGVSLGDVVLGRNGAVTTKAQFDLPRHKSRNGVARINISFADGHVETRSITSTDLATAYLVAR